jgi:hypothetical protein
MNNKPVSISTRLLAHESGGGLIATRPAWVIRVPKCPYVADMSIAGDALFAVGWDGSGYQAILAASLADASTRWTRDDVSTGTDDTNLLLLKDRLFVDGHVLNWPTGELLHTFFREADQAGFSRSLLLGGAGHYAAYEMFRDEDGSRCLGIYDAAQQQFFLRPRDLQEPGIFFEQGLLLGVIDRTVALYDFVNDAFRWKREVAGPTAGSHGVFCDGTAAYVVSGEGQLLKLCLETGGLLGSVPLPAALREAAEIKLSVVGASDALYIHKHYPRPSVACGYSLPDMRLLWETPGDDWDCFCVVGDLVYASIETWALPPVLRAHDRHTGTVVREFTLPLKPNQLMAWDDGLIVRDMHGQIACFAFEERYCSPHRPA